MSPGAIFLGYSADKLEQQSARIADCLDRLSEEQIWSRTGEGANAAGNLVLHLCGNVGQWIGSGVSGEPDTRKRDAEFANRGDASREQLKQQLAATIRAAVTVIRALPEQRLSTRVRVQNYDVTVLEAIYHVVEHFSGHTGQIIFATKLLTGSDLGYYAHLNQAAHAERVP